MSARPCGCDQEAAHMCDEHFTDAMERVTNGAQDALKSVVQSAFDADARRIAEAAGAPSNDYRTMDPRDPRFLRGAVHRQPPSLTDLMTAVQATHAKLSDDMQSLFLRVEQLQKAQSEPSYRLQWMEQRQAHIAKILADFYCSSLTLSSVQPIMYLARELNPDLLERNR